MNPDGDKTRYFEIRTSSELNNIRLDRFLAEYPEIDITRTQIQKLINNGLVLVNGRTVAKNYIIKKDEVVSVTIPPPRRLEITAEAIPLEIVHEDDFLAVVNKPAGMVTHPGAGNYSGTLTNALVHHFEKLARGSTCERPGIVHRLDKNTSGLILVAKTDDIYLLLQQLMQRREIKRTYIALVCGHLDRPEGEIDLPIGRSIKDRKKMAVTNIGSRSARTDFHVTDSFRSYDLLKVRLHTGRTHQIRVHFSHLGHPVFGDPDYGGRLKWHRGLFGPERRLGQRLLEIINRQALHAHGLTFIHPVTGEKIVLEIGLPEDFEKLLQTLDGEGR